MEIKITFLGTGAVVPTETRNHTSILLNYNEENILVDCGEGTQRQLRKAKINPCKITRLLITHWHGDHILGIPGLFQTLALNNYQKTLFIYGPRGTKKYIDEIFKIFVNNRINTEVREVDGEFLETKDFYLTALKMDHETPCNGYSFTEKEKLRIKKSSIKKLKINPEERYKLSHLTKGKNIKINNKKINYKKHTYIQPGKKISFILDTRLSENVKKIAKDSDLAIIESTFLEAESGKQMANEYFHLTAKQAAEIAKSSKVKQLILTHISQRYQYKEKKLLDEARKIFKNTKLAEDFMTIKI